MISRPNVLDAARRITAPALIERAQRVQLADAGHGYDRFGVNRDWIAFALGLFAPLYERYFRVSSYGAENIPAKGGAILAANHSGTIPIDAMMIWNDVVRNTEPPRVPRIVMDYFVGLLPFVGGIFARAGAVGGSRGNMHALLEAGELVGVFPEGVPGIGKPFSERYRLKPWRGGHVEMAIRHQVPVVPIAVVGAEEQLPQIARLPIRAFGSPYLPVSATPLPLPVHYHIYYGPPIDFTRRFAPSDADDPSIIRAGAAEVGEVVQRMLDAGVAARPGVFT